MVQAGNGPAVEGLADKLHILALNVLHHHDLHLVKEVDGQVGQSVAEDGLLDEENIAAGLLDLLDNVEDVGALLPQHAIHCRVVGYDHLENRHSWLTIKLLLSCTNNK